jgi:ribosomal protein S18 acetylase RimI-like enzyme
MELKIETASIKQLDELFRIEEDCFDQEAFTKQQIAYLLRDFNTIALIAKSNLDIAGFVIAQIEVEENTEYGHIVTINVAPKFRRKGIATRMLQEIEIFLRQRSITQIRLEVREDNNTALKLYNKLDYKTQGKLDRYYGNKHGIYLNKTF